jgi:hypothetical protein
MGVTAGILLASILLKEMRYLVYIRYLCLSDAAVLILLVHTVVIYLINTKQDEY